MIRIVEVIRRSEQGVTRPFLCRADDGMLYYAKGRGAGARALAAEWIAGRIGAEWGLPIPPFQIADVSRALVRSSLRDDLADLGEGPCFASRAVEGAMELNWPDSLRVPAELRLRVLLFDCWIANPDRQLSEGGGNVNLLWEPTRRLLHVIDHNLAFGQRSAREVAADHVFRAERARLPKGSVPPLREQMQAALDRCWPACWQELPEEWTDRLVAIDKDAVFARLSRFADLKSELSAP